VLDEENAPTLDTEPMARALAFLRSLNAEHRVMPRDCGIELADTMFKEGRAAMIINGPWSWSAYRDAGIDIALTPIPMVKATGLWPTPMVSYRGYCVASTVTDAAMPLVKELVEFLTSEEVQLNYLTRSGSLPSLRAALESDYVEDNEITRQSVAQVQKGRRMPVVLQMRAIWDALRPGYQRALIGAARPEDAARTMQEDAERKISEMMR
jgi:maltose-binding protein MalE